jgi:hypothetical protein
MHVKKETVSWDDKMSIEIITLTDDEKVGPCGKTKHLYVMHNQKQLQC